MEKLINAITAEIRELESLLVFAGNEKDEVRLALAYNELLHVLCAGVTV